MKQLQNQQLKKKAIKGMVLGEDSVRKVLLVELAGQLAPLASCVPKT